MITDQKHQYLGEQKIGSTIWSYCGLFDYVMSLSLSYTFTWTTLPRTKISFVLRSVRKQFHLVLDSKLLNIPFFFHLLFTKAIAIHLSLWYASIMCCVADWFCLWKQLACEHCFLSDRHKLKFSDYLIPACRAIQNNLRNDLQWMTWNEWDIFSWTKRNNQLN